MTDERKATGFVRVIERAVGPVFYAQIRTPDGRRLQRRLGKVWSKRSRPADGYVTRAEAELRLSEILAGRDANVIVQPRPGSDVTFGQAAREWMRYVEHDRKRRPSTIRDYRRELETRLIPEFGEDTPLSEITTANIEAFRERLVTEGRLSPRAINKRLAQLHAIFKRAQRAFELPLKSRRRRRAPAAGADR